MAFYDPYEEEIKRLRQLVAELKLKANEQAAYIHALEERAERQPEPDCPMCDVRQRLAAVEERLQNTLEVNHLWDGS